MQRQHGFNGGIQNGMVATDAFAKRLDHDLKTLKDELEVELKDQGFVCRKKLDKNFLLEHGVFVGCEPDGGLWFKDGKLVAAFEGKKQGKGGNAIERWEKNYGICKDLNPNIKYVTFGAREGFETDGYPYRYAKTMLNRENKELNTLYEQGQSWFVSPIGFAREEIKSIMKQALTGGQ
jgi:hypothetical protein